MKKRLLLLILGLTLMLSGAVPALALSLDFGNLGTLAFSSGSFSFKPDSGYDFQLTLAYDWVDTRTHDALNPDNPAINGNISETFTLGTINNGQATVSGTGTLSLWDTDTPQKLLTANLKWVDITSTGGVLATLNGQATANISGVTYTGDNLDLQKFKTGGIGVLTFPFANTLQNLKEGSLNTSYSMTLSPVPLPNPWLLMATSFLVLARLRRRKKQE